MCLCAKERGRIVKNALVRTVCVCVCVKCAFVYHSNFIRDRIPSCDFLVQTAVSYHHFG